MNLLERLQWLYFCDTQKGVIIDRLAGKRADRVFFDDMPARAYARYREVEVAVDGGSVRLPAHNMIWAAAHGRWPAAGMALDHLNNNVQDNRLCNLAEVTDAENRRRGRIRRFVYLLHANP